MVPTHQRQTGGQIVLRVSILNKTLSLGAHNVVGKIGDTRSRRSPHNRRDSRIVTGGPANRSKIKPCILRRPIVFESAQAGVEIKSRGGVQTIVVGNGGRISRIFFRAAVRTEPVLQWVNGQIQNIPITEPDQEPFLVGEILVYTCNDLVLVASGPGDRIEVVDCARRSWDSGAICLGPKIKKRPGRRADSAGGDYVALEGNGRGGAAGASAHTIH